MNEEIRNPVLTPEMVYAQGNCLGPAHGGVEVGWFWPTSNETAIEAKAKALSLIREIATLHGLVTDVEGACSGQVFTGVFW
jgi:hypothetical protein